MSDVTVGVSSVLLIVALLGSLVISGLFFWFCIKQPTWQGKITCLVLSVMALLPIFYVLLLTAAIRSD